MPADSGRPADQVDWDALARFFAGESSAAEAEAASRWLAEHPEEAEKFASLEAVTARMAEPLRSKSSFPIGSTAGPLRTPLVATQK